MRKKFNFQFLLKNWSVHISFENLTFDKILYNTYENIHGNFKFELYEPVHWKDKVKSPSLLCRIYVLNYLTKWWKKVFLKIINLYFHRRGYSGSE